ncbi:sorting nexin lst-4-like [Physella acuta]|uniref:sorting nexin lst-4-like n=1 Tax=Physella acuta TaxID=109671 RepID=UPI0027DE4EAC|nr:sorting nexin lst-4-like [Physella acuta]XP_059166547.1 sorting nexin lst-4-like [Physella acuta]
MAAIQGRCLYDFDGDESNGELSFVAGETLYILRQDIGDGWWEARSADGKHGLVPETYIEIVSVPEPEFPPPPPPVVTSSLPSAPPLYPSNGFSGSPPGLSQQQSFDDWDDDEWDDDDGESSNSTTGTTQDLGGQGNFGLAVPKREGKKISPGTEMSKYGTVKSSFSRFSHFAKSGGEAFLMGQAVEKVNDSERIKIIETADGPMWLKEDSAFTCAVTSPKKESKMKGLKSYIAYHLQPSFSNIIVSRRYKHFDWLHGRLECKFVCIPIPPLPDKAVTGRYEEDFIQERMRQLQAWVNRMVRHPVISRSDVFHHFLTCTDDKKWKVGKRNAEKDQFQGGKFFQVLQPPTKALDLREVEPKMELFCKFVLSMTENIKTLITVHQDYAKKQIGPFKREYGRIGASYKQLAQTFNMDTNPASRNLTAAIDYTGDAFNDIGEMFAKQPPRDAYPLIESFYEYKGLLQTYPDALKVHEGAIGKAKECLKLQEEGKMQETEVQSVLSRADTISYGTLAEMNHFQHERVIDYKSMMQSYLKEQIDFYKKLTSKLEDALHRYDNA